MENFISKRTPDSMFVALGMNLVKPEGGVLAMINSLAAVTSASALDRRRVLAERFYIHTIVICRHPRELNLSESTNINECIIVACRRDEVKAKADTRFIALDKFPKSEDEVDELQRAINDSSDGVMAEGWGEMMLWPAERMNKGDWTPALWRSSELAQASYEYANDGRFKTLAETGVPAVLMSIDKSSGYQPAEPDEPYAFVGLRSAGSDAHTHIEAVPNGCWKPVDPPTLPMSDQYKDPIWGNAGHLFVTAGQNAKSGRLTALASETKYVATEWMPIPQASTRQAKALAVFFNSTPGRLQLMRNLGRSLVYPRYRPTGVGKVRIPDVNDERAIGILVDCFERTKGKKVSQFGEGECEVRKAWDEAVADAMTCVQDGCKHEDCGTELWDIETITALRKLLHKEPHVSGRGHGQFDL